MSIDDQNVKHHQDHPEMFKRFQERARQARLGDLIQQGCESAMAYADVEIEDRQVLGYFSDSNPESPSTYISILGDQYYLTLGNCEYVGPDLAKLEALLFDWMVDEEYISVTPNG